MVRPVAFHGVPLPVVHVDTVGIVPPFVCLVGQVTHLPHGVVVVNNINVLLRNRYRPHARPRIVGYPPVVQGSIGEFVFRQICTEGSGIFDPSVFAVENKDVASEAAGVKDEAVFLRVLFDLAGVNDGL